MLNRAYSVLTVKSVDEEKRIIEGIATTPSPDRSGDIVEPDGIEFQLPLPLLNQHRASEPIGNVIAAKVTKNGIWIKAQIAPAGVIPYVDTVWQQIKHRLVRGLSIGFKSIEDRFLKDTGGIHFVRSMWLELSTVTIPMNADANITTVKSHDSASAAAGTSTRTVSTGGQTANPPAVVGTTRKPAMKTIKEQIEGWEAKRAALSARMSELTAKSSEEDRTFDPAEKEEYRNHTQDVEEIEEQLVVLRKEEKRLLTTVRPVTPANTATPEAAAAMRAPNGGSGGRAVVIGNRLEKGQNFARCVIALGFAEGNRQLAAQHARQTWPDSPEVELFLKTETIPGTTTGTTWAAPLVPNAAMLGDFIDLLRPATLIGQIPGLREVPFNVSVPVQSGGGTYTWVGELVAKPVSGLALATVTLRWAKVAGIIPFTKELMRFSNPAVEILVRNDMVKGMSQYLDEQFVDPAVNESVNVSPASITAGINPTPATGTTATAFRTDMKTMFAVFNGNLQNATAILMSNTIATNLSMMVNSTTSMPEFPTITPNGGTLWGIPVYVSKSVGAQVILLNAEEILIARDGGVEIDVSQEASLVMTTTPESSPQATTLVSLFQRNLVAIRTEIFTTWKKARTTSVHRISTAAYA